MNNTDILHPSFPFVPDDKNYFLSLTEQAREYELITDKDISEIRAGLTEILSSELALLTKGESSSVPAEKSVFAVTYKKSSQQKCSILPIYITVQQ